VAAWAPSPWRIGERIDSMKLNFWQWLAVVLLIIGCVWWIYDATHKPAVNAPGPTTLSATQNIAPK
jgi:hypothetical protein